MSVKARHALHIYAVIQKA